MSPTASTPPPNTVPARFAFSKQSIQPGTPLTAPSISAGHQENLSSFMMYMISVAAAGGESNNRNPHTGVRQHVKIAFSGEILRKRFVFAPHREYRAASRLLRQPLLIPPFILPISLAFLV